MVVNKQDRMWLLHEKANKIPCSLVSLNPGGTVLQLQWLLHMLTICAKIVSRNLYAYIISETTCEQSPFVHYCMIALELVVDTK